MDTKSLLLGILAILVLLAGYNYYVNNIQAAQYHVSTTNPTLTHHDTSSDIKYIPKHPSVIAILATKPGCLYCDIIKNELKDKTILQEYNVENDIQYGQLISKLDNLGLEYIGVPTVLIGTYAFYSYQDTDECPYFNGEQSQPVLIKIGEETVELCRVPGYPHYYIYMPSKVFRLIELCNKYKDPTCYA